VIRALAKEDEIGVYQFIFDNLVNYRFFKVYIFYSLFDILLKSFLFTQGRLNMPSSQQLPASSKTLADTVYSQIRSDIINGKLKPDSRLKIERLRQEYNVGATPVREALSRLSASGFVVIEGQRGFKVPSVSAEDLTDITEMRIMLELKALRKSIQHGDDDWESHVVASYHQLSKLETQDVRDNLDEWEKRNRQFHYALIAACSSKWLIRFYNTLYDQHKRYRAISLNSADSSRNIHAEHQRIYQAALNRDVETACRETEAHIRLTAERTLKFLNQGEI
jgi:DNA-binding GntR family transcriptional regulator